MNHPFMALLSIFFFQIHCLETGNSLAERNPLQGQSLPVDSAKIYPGYIERSKAREYAEEQSRLWRLGCLKGKEQTEMAMKKVYYTVNGMLIGEKAAGGSRVDYLTDTLGNITATVDQSANIINTYRYKPFGGLLAKTGVGADPAFQWVGSPGYRQTGKSYSDVYIRRRHYSSEMGRWTTMDPIKYKMLRVEFVARNSILYVYSNNNPTGRIDPSGLGACADMEKVFNRFDQWAQDPQPYAISNDPNSPFYRPVSAATDCPPLGQGPKSWYFVNFGPQAQPCLEAHEDVHRKAIGECCNKFQEAYRAATPVNKDNICQKWINYMKGNQIPFECSGYATEYRCLTPLWKSYKCDEWNWAAGQPEAPRDLNRLERFFICENLRDAIQDTIYGLGTFCLAGMIILGVQRGPKCPF